MIVATEPHIIHQMEKAAPAQDLHRRARRRRQLQLQHVPLHGAQHDGEALRRRCATSQPRIEIEEGLRLAAKKSLDRMLEMAGGTVGKGDVGKPMIYGRLILIRDAGVRAVEIEAGQMIMDVRGLFMGRGVGEVDRPRPVPGNSLSEGVHRTFPC